MMAYIEMTNALITPWTLLCQGMLDDILVHSLILWKLV